MTRKQSCSLQHTRMNIGQPTKALERALQLVSAQKGKTVALFVLLLGALVYLPYLSNPAHPYWDEYYYLPAVQRHIEGTATYASHPPLGFMLLAAGPTIVGDNKGVQTHSLAGLAKITDRDVPKGYSFVGIRLPSATAAVIGGLLFCMIMLRLGLDGYAALAFSTLYIFENAFVIQFRGALLDSFEIAFVLAGLLVWLRKARDALSWRDYALFGAFIGLSVSVKTNAAVLMAIPAIAVMHEIWTRQRRSRAWVLGAVKAGAALGAFAFAIVVVFTVNIALSPHPPDSRTEAGRQDLERMSPAYQDYLQGRTGLTIGAWRGGIAGYVIRMRNDFSGVTRNDSNGQNPLTWPFFVKPISYRWDSNGAYTFYSTMVGNPVGWPLSLVGIVGGIVLVSLRRFRAQPAPFDLADDFVKLEAVLIMYGVYLATHVYMGMFRVMYIYHYFIGLILGFIALALSWKIVRAGRPELAKRENAILAGMSLLVALGFWFYSPFIYHRPITKTECELRNILVRQFSCVGN